MYVYLENKLSLGLTIIQVKFKHNPVFVFVNKLMIERLNLSMYIYIKIYLYEL